MCQSCRKADSSQKNVPGVCINLQACNWDRVHRFPRIYLCHFQAISDLDLMQKEKL